MPIAADNQAEVGRAYIYQYVNGAVDYRGNRNIEVSVSLRYEAPPVASAIHLQMEAPGVGVINEFDLQNRGLSADEWTTLTFPVENIDPNGGLFRIHFNFAAGAVVGAGGILLVDNVVVRPGVQPEPECAQDADCAEGEACNAGLCGWSPSDPNGCPSDCAGCFDAMLPRDQRGGPVLKQRQCVVLPA